MFRIKEHKKLGQTGFWIESTSGVQVYICASLGGSLQYWKCKDQEIIKDSIGDYQTSYRGAILFPFANRVSDGNYFFKDINYQLALNEGTNKHAIHGLLHDQKVCLAYKKAEQNLAILNFVYSYKGDKKGFPWKYELTLEYTIRNTGITLKIVIKNTDQKMFPFVLGWHPYFVLNSRAESKIEANTCASFFCDDKMIPKEKRSERREEFDLEENFDNGFQCVGKELKLSTNSYELTLKSQKASYVQIYTPDSSNEVAIEPMTGATNAFNNLWGLRVLEPKACFREEWKIEHITK